METLKYGSIGDNVIKLQKKIGVKADGDFGSGTETAVKQWQSKNGLKADGIVGPDTWSKMGLDTVGPASAPAASVPGNSGELKLDKLKGLLPDSVLSQIADTAKKFNITTNLRLAHFLAQCAHESGNFKAVTENLNYSADGLKKTFSKYFPDDATANSYARQPEKIASRVYANRMGNGNEASKEGYSFRGRGYIQLTGKSNYQKFTSSIGEDVVANPDLVATKYPLSSAAFFFHSNSLWSICDQGSTDAVVTSVTKRVNGGTNGLADRLAYFKKYYAVLK